MIEIRELIIRATITNNTAGATTDSQAAAGGNPATPELLQECIEQVFQIMDDKKER